MTDKSSLKPLPLTTQQEQELLGLMPLYKCEIDDVDLTTSIHSAISMRDKQWEQLLKEKPIQND